MAHDRQTHGESTVSDRVTATTRATKTRMSSDMKPSSYDREILNIDLLPESG
jgi:hypothetical protein